MLHYTPELVVQFLGPSSVTNEFEALSESIDGYASSIGQKTLSYFMLVFAKLRIYSPVDTLSSVISLPAIWQERSIDLLALSLAYRLAIWVPA